MFAMRTPVVEIVLRIVLIYVGLLLLVRISGKREVGQLGPVDLLSMLIVSETVSPALTRGDASISASLLAAGLLLGISSLMSRLTFRWRRLEALVDGSPRRIIENGRIDTVALAAERLSGRDIESALRRHGIVSLADVLVAFVETNGDITIVKRHS